MTDRNTSLPRAWAEIDLAAAKHNLKVARELSGINATVLAVVKADAYGHGATKLAATWSGETRWFAVASLAEAREVASAVPGASLLLLGPALPWEREQVVREGFTPCVSTFEEAKAYNELASPQKPFPIHLVVDTGMGRIGLLEDGVLEAVLAICRLPNLEVQGFASHLPSADEDFDFTARQIQSFSGIVAEVKRHGVVPTLLHTQNSAGLLAFGDAGLNMYRIGLALYGISPLPSEQAKFQPVMSFKTRVALVRELPAGHGVSYGRSFITPRPMLVATLSAGYADGYPRSLSGRSASVILRGQRCPLLGRVTMDLIMVDVSELSEVAIGDEAVLFGRQGEEVILATEIARKAGTIAWEIFTGISSRVPRLYL